MALPIKFHAKKMKAEGKDFKPIFGVEAYFIKDLDEWKKTWRKTRKTRRKLEQLAHDKSGVNIENEGDSKAKVQVNYQSFSSFSFDRNEPNRS